MADAPRIREANVILNEQHLTFRLFNVPRRRHVHVLVNEKGELEVRAPWRYAVADTKDVISEHTQWVLDQIKSQRARARTQPQLVSGSRLPLLDDHLVLRFKNIAQRGLFDEPGAKKSHRVYREDATLWVVLQAIQDSQQVHNSLERWYRQQAREIFPQRMQSLAQQLGVRYRRISIRAQRTCWGSCSPGGGISLNWRLLLLPESLCDYVLAHELCHLREMNHSSRFWSLVGTVIPDYQSKRNQLRQIKQPLAL